MGKQDFIIFFRTFELDPNKTKELSTACPYYYGEETTLRDPNDTEVKRFNPVFDIMS